MPTKPLSPSTVLVLVVIIICLCPYTTNRGVYALDPQKALTQYIHETWTKEDGLPDDSIKALIQTRDGYIWLGTELGLVRFDGVRFTGFSHETADAISNSAITGLFEDSQGRLWIGTQNKGLTIYQDGKFKSFTEQDGLASNNLTSFCEDREGAIWIGTFAHGLMRYKDGKFTHFTTRDGLASDDARVVYTDKAGNLWVGCWQSGLHRYQAGKFTVYTGKDQILKITHLIEDRAGNLWIGTMTGLKLFKDGVFTAFSAQNGLASDTISSIHEDRDGNIWIGTQRGGLAVYKNRAVSSFTAKDGLLSNIINTIYEDREGSLWFGSQGGGLNRLLDSKLTTITTREGLSHDLATPIYQDRAGNIWIGTFGGGLNKYSGGKFTIYTMKDGMSSNNLNSICEDAQGNIWFGTYGGGINSFKDGKFRVFTTKDGLSKNDVKTVYDDGEGNLWIGTDGGGLNRFRDGKFTVYTTRDGLPDNNVGVVVRARSGGLWIGTAGGLCLYKDQKFTTFTTRDGLSSNEIQAIYQDNEGVLWLGTYNGGLVRFKDNKFTAFTTRQHPLLTTINQVLEDDNENLWMSCANGVFYINKQELNNFAAGLARSINVVAFGKIDGMKSEVCSRFFQPAGCRTRDGKLWFPTIKGVVTIDPANIKHNHEIPPVLIEKVVTDDQAVDLTGAQVFPASINRFEFHFTGLSFIVPARVKFKYKLEGVDKSWLDPGQQRVAYYTTLAPGEYTFRIIACNNDGVWNETGASYRFRLQPPVWQTWWAYLLYFAAFVSLGLGTFSWRVRALKERQEERVKYLSQLLESTRVINSRLDLDTVLQNIAEQSAKLINCEPGGIGLVEGNSVVFKRLWLKDHWENSTLVFRHGEGVAGRVLATASPVIVNDPKGSPELVQPELLKKFNVEGFLDLPIVTRTGKVVGVLDVRRPHGGASFTATDCRLLEALANQAAVAIENASLYGQLETTVKELAEEKELLAVTLRNIGDGVIATDAHGSVVLMNEIAEKLLEITQERALGQTLSQFFHLINEETRERCPDPVAQALETGAIVELAAHALRISQTGEEQYIAGSAAPIRNREGDSIGVVLVFRDITAKKKMDAEMLKATKLESIGVLAGGIAHDFNNLLTAIIGNLSLAIKSVDPREKQYKKLSEIEKASLQARNLTQQLLTFAKGGLPIVNVVPIGNLLRDTAIFTLRGSNIQCEFHLPDDLWLVEIDEGQMNQVISNLVINAKQAMPTGGKIEISAENIDVDPSGTPPLAAGRYVKISIKDYGSGIPKEYLQKIFDPYFTTKPTGSGLGLATSYAIIKKHDGYITVASEPGRGTTFDIYLPAARREAAPVVVSPKRSFAGQGKILIMDDQPVILELSKEILSEQGFEVETAEEGGKAIELYQAAQAAGRPFDIVILDLTVPGGLGGKETIEVLRRLDPEVKAIVSSGYSNDPIMADFRSYGFSGVLVKPYRVTDMIELLNNVRSDSNIVH